MASSRPPTPYSLGRFRRDSSRDSQDEIRSPQAFLSPDSPKQASLKPESPSRRVLFDYQHVLFLCRKSVTPLSSLIRQKTPPEPIAEPVTNPDAQPKSIMSLKLDHLRDKWHDLKTRTSPAVFHYAGYIFLVIVLTILGCLIVSWYGLSNDTLAHETVTIEPTQRTPMVIDYPESFWPIQTSTEGQPDIRALRDVTKESIVPATHPFTTKSSPMTSLDELENITGVTTVIVTVTSVIPDMAPKTLTTTVFLSMCIDTIDSRCSTTEDIMTGIMYCSFTGRRNIYTLCPLVHTSSPAMLTDAPVAVSSGTPRMKNSFSAVRLAVVSLWNSIPALGSVMQARDHGRCACDCAGTKKKLDAATELIRMQQRLLDSQQTMIHEHRKGLFTVLETLANMTAARVGGKTPRDTPLDLNI
ncbi:hypothetical protein F4823DRAFT_586225 [Ustulina deusta]|nr:hypothetical protein F4823DRAFT_586225 [Ustulina deusta]